MAGETTIDIVSTSVFDAIMVADIDIAKAERRDVFFFSTLQYSITPLLQGRNFQEILAIFKLAFYGP
jgi:hypothetical protein